MNLILSIILLIIFFKLFFAIGSGLIKIILGLVGFCILLTLLPISLVLMIPLLILAVVVSLFIGLIQWIL